MPTLLDLAPELLLSILLEPQLDYKDLKRTSRVCRKLYKIEQDSSLDHKMFRKGLPSCEGKNGKVVLVKEGQEVRHHPILDYADLASSSIDEIGPSLSTFFSYRTRGFNSVPPTLGKQVIDFECMNEYATSPPSRHIRLDLVPSTNCSSKWIEVINDNGVKVVDVLKGICNMWKTATPEAFRERSNRRLEIQLLSQVLPQSQEDPAQELFSYLKQGNPLYWRQTVPPAAQIECLSAARVEEDCVELKAEWG